VSTLAHRRIYHPRGAFLDREKQPFDVIPRPRAIPTLPCLPLSLYLDEGEEYIGGRKSFMEAVCALGGLAQAVDEPWIRRIFDLRQL
jgi:hypothetical protein